MAEFQEVMRQWNRMCNTIGVQNRIKCPFVHTFDIQYCESCFDCTLADPAQAEEIIMSWAAEHPEPVYPTWYEYLYKKFGHTTGDRLNDPIPADIAQKLGIEPKEGT